METRKPYPTDLSDKEWDLIQPLVPIWCPPPSLGGARRNIPSVQSWMPSSLSFVVAVPGACCRMTFPPGRWSISTSGAGGTMAPGSAGMICSEAMRVAAGKRLQPSAAILASQSVKTTEKGGSVGTMPARR